MLAAVTIPHGPQATLGSSCHSRGRAWKSSGLCIQFGGLPKWTTGTVCKTAGSAFVGSNPTATTKRPRELQSGVVAHTHAGRDLTPARIGCIEPNLLVSLRE
jgi:hypothetical protein